MILLPMLDCLLNNKGTTLGVGCFDDGLDALVMEDDLIE
jgi:hypothetical protein